MKTLRQLLVASVLTFVFIMPAFAGQIDTTVAPPQPAPTATTGGGIETTAAGQTETPSSEATASDSATQVALNLLQSMLSLF
jgi:uncharacterized membrane protein